MATFINRATLSYNNTTATSNTVTGEIVGSLTVNKTALPESYAAGDDITYVVNVINSGTSAFSGLTLTDSLGAFAFGTGQLVPLTYVDGSLRQFTNGAPVTPSTVAESSPLTLTGVSVPAGGVTTLVYTVEVNEYAPLSAGSQIINTVDLTSPLLGTVATATATVTASDRPMLSIEKALSPSTVTPNGQLTYTFTIRNSGNVEAAAADNVTLADTFDPILSNISVTNNGQPITAPDGYTYDATTGEFATVPGVITVPAATFTQDPVTGEQSFEPGVTVITVTGTI